MVYDASLLYMSYMYIYIYHLPMKDRLIILNDDLDAFAKDKSCCISRTGFVNVYGGSRFIAFFG